MIVNNFNKKEAKVSKVGGDNNLVIVEIGDLSLLYASINCEDMVIKYELLTDMFNTMKYIMKCKKGDHNDKWELYVYSKTHLCLKQSGELYLEVDFSKLF